MGGLPGAFPFNGGNSEFLSHPPTTFDGIAYRAGRVEAVGYRAGRAVARDVVFTPGPATHATIRIDTQGRPLEADGADFVFVYVELRDAHDQIVPDESRRVRLTANGQPG